MGVRFACHACGKRLNIKAELAGRRGICPQCETKFRIPLEDTELSIPLDASAAFESSTESESISQSAVASAPTNTSNVAEPSRRSVANGSAATATASKANASPDSLLGGAEATWYVRPPSGGQYGPADGLVMKQWINEGRVSDTAMVWRDGWNDWQPATSILSGSHTENPDVKLNAIESGLENPTTKSANNDDPTKSTWIATEPANTGELTTKAPARPTASSRNPRVRANRRVTLNVALAIVFVCLLAVLIFVVATQSGG